MAGDWIKMRTDLPTSPKVVRMASALKADRFRTVGGLLSVWSLFDAHSDDGKLHGYSLATVNDLAAWDGFAEAMVSVGWLEFDGETLTLPRFDTHNGASAKRRAQDADRKRVRRMSASDADTCPQNVFPREEKRREEKEQEQKHCASAVAAAPVRSDPIPYQAVVDAFNATMIGLAKVRLVTNERKTLIRSAWNTSPKFQTLAFWSAYFAECQDDPFLNGAGPYAAPHANWRPSFEHLLAKKTITKTYERAMDNLERAA